MICSKMEKPFLFKSLAQNLQLPRDYKNRFNFEFNVDLDYDWELGDEHETECEEEGICRCGKIKNVQIEQLNFHELVNKIINSLSYGFYTRKGKRYHKGKNYLTELDYYAIQRICTLYGLYDKNNYEIDVGNGYYGEEVNGVFLSLDDDANIQKHIIHVLNEFQDSPIQKIFYLLELEYKFILDDLKQVSNYEIMSFNPKYLGRNNVEINRIKRNREEYIYPQDFKYPIGIVYNDRLIDGHNRTLDAIFNDVETAKYIVLFD